MKEYALVALLIMLGQPKTHASDGVDLLTGSIRLACEAKLCLAATGGTPAACAPSLRKLDKLLDKKGFKAVRHWLNTCPDGGDTELTDFVLSCTDPWIFRSLYEMVDTGDGMWEKRARLDVPKHCKQFVQAINTEYAALRLTMPKGYAATIPDAILLPVRSMRWREVEEFDDFGAGSVVRYVPEYVWSYQDSIPTGYAVVYDPNTNTRYAAPASPTRARNLQFFTR